MNVVATYLQEHRNVLGLEELGLPRDPAFVLITPRFAQSRHVVMLVLGRDSAEPVLAAKLPRLAGDGDELAQEAANLQAAGWAVGDDGTVPRVVAYAPELKYPLLLQRALTGRPLGPAEVRRNRAAAVEKVAAWCDRLGASTIQHDAEAAHLDRLIMAPLRTLAGPTGPGGQIAELARRTYPLAQELVAARPPLVFEHGDLGHPNLLVGADGKLGVLDFERAEHAGLPGFDLLVFCTYAAASASARGVSHGISEAFHGRSPWAAEAFAAHLRRLGVEPHLEPALLAVSCARVVAQAVAAGAGPVAGGRDAAARHMALWSGSVDLQSRPMPAWTPMVVPA